MSAIDVTGEFGIVVRRQALIERRVSLEALLEALEVESPLDSNDSLMSFGPSFGQEALDVFTRRLIDLGFEYFDDFFEFVGTFPAWCRFQCLISSQ